MFIYTEALQYRTLECYVEYLPILTVELAE